MNTTDSAAAEWRKYWYLPVAAAFGYSAAVMHTYSMGPFIQPLHQEFGWSRAQISLGLTIAGVTGTVLSVPLGMLIDRVGPRPIALLGVLLMSGAFALLGTATGGKANWVMLWGFLALGNLCLQSTVWASAVATRFEVSRGVAFGVTLSGASIAGSIFPVLATRLIGAYGWRTAFMGIGGIWATLVFPILFLFFRGARDTGRKAPRVEPGVPTEGSKLLTGLGVAEGLRSPAFFKLLLASGLFAFMAIGTIVHFVPILTDRGAAPLAAAKIASLVGIFSIFGRLSTGLLLDRLPGHIVGATVFLLPIIACALLLLDGANPPSQAVAAAVFGLTVGAEVDVIAYLASRHFGLKNFGVFFGAMTGALALGAALGPLVAGALFDRNGSYSAFLTLTIVFMAASSAALVTLGHPRFGAT
jgi:MFS family permease